MSKNVSNTIRESKKKSISQIASIGRKYKVLKYPILLFLVIFIFVYNFVYYLCKYFKMKECMAKAIAVAMCAVLVVTSINLTAFAIDGVEDVDSVKNITGISSLSDEIANQKINPDATLEDIVLPENLDVHVTYQVEKEIEVEVEEEVEQDVSTPSAGIESTPSAEPTSSEEAVSGEERISEESIPNEEPTTTPKVTPDGDPTSDVETESTEEPQGEDVDVTETSDEQPAEDSQSDDTQDNDAQNNDTQSDDTQNDDSQSNNAQDKDIENQPEGEQSAKIENCEYDSITTIYAPMEYCAIESDGEEIEVETLEKDETEAESETKTVIRKETVIEDIEEDAAVSVEWAIDEENSSKEEFKDLEVGEEYIFVPTIAEDGYALNDGVELPVIKVIVEESQAAFEQSVTVDGVVITVMADEGVFPEGATIEARKVTTSEENEVAEAIDEVRDEEKNVAVSYTFDITIYDKAGKEIEPNPEKGSVKVTFKMEEIANENLETDVYHVEETDDGLNAEGLAVANENSNTDGAEGAEVSEKTDDEITVETTGFSFYTVEFTYGELQYVLEGDEKVALSEILEAVEIKENGEISKVEGSDDELFKPVFDEEEKIWYIEAFRAFNTEEWLKVTIGGVEYEIVVTDDITGPTAYVNNYEELVSAIGNSSVTKIVVQQNIDVPCVTAPAAVLQNAKTAQININHSLVIEGINRDITIKRVPAEGATRNSLVSIFEIEGNNSSTDNIEVVIRNITIHGGCEDFSASDAPIGAPKINTPASVINEVAGRSIIDVYKLATLTVENATIRNGITCNCISTHGFDVGAYGYGGAIRVEFSVPNNLAGGTVNIKVGSLITTCAATISQTDWSIGGAIGCFNKGHLNLYGGTITNCYATLGGAIGTNARLGAIGYDDAGTISMYGGEISGCYAGQGGAIAYLRGTSACQNYIYGGKINDCHSGRYLRSGDNACGDAIAIDSKWKTEKIQVTLPSKESGMLQIANCSGGTNNNSTNRSGGTHSYSGIYLLNNDATDNKIVIDETVKLNFKLSESEDYGQIIIKKGTSAGASFPGDPIKENKEFVSWYKEGDDSQTAVTKDTVFDNDATLLPLWCHDFSYIGNGNKLTATCSKSYCKLPEKSVSLYVNAADADNTGLAYDMSNVVLTDMSTFNSKTGKNVSTDNAVFYTDAACTTETNAANSGAESNGGAPKNIGTYYVKVIIPETSACAVDSFKINSAHNHNDIDFTLWTSTTSLPTTAGSYCLANDIELTSAWTVPAGTVNLCLNGHVIKLKPGSSGSVIYITNNGTNFNLYDCDTTTEHYFDTSTTPWTLTNTEGANTRTISGGVITGGTGTYTGSTTYGGGIYLYLDNSAPQTSFKMYGGNIVGNSSTQSGGGVCIRHNPSSFDMYGGTIQGNYCEANSGGVSVHNGTANLNGGQILYNKAGVLAGGVLLYQGILNVTDTVISNNEAGETAGGLEVFNKNFTIGGSAKIVDNIANGKDSNLYFANQYVMNFGVEDSAPKSGMSVGVNTDSTKPIAISAADNTDYSQYFTSDDSKYAVYYKDADKKLYLGTLPTVNVDLNGGSYPTGSTALEGWTYDSDNKVYTKKVVFKTTLPTAPTPPTGKTFKGWEYNSTVVDAGAEVTLTDAENRTYKAKYEINKYTVSFDVQSHGTAPASLTDVEHGTTIEKPTDPSETGYEFDGWYKEAACTNAWNFETDTVTSATTLYAKWTANQYTITYKDKGDFDFSGTHESGYPTTHTYGTATALKSASKTNYTFVGWYTSSDCSGDAITSLGSTAYTGNITLYAKWIGKHQVTAPTALNPTYNGNEQVLISAGSCATGTIKYSLDGTNYYESIDSIKKKEVGSYTVYYKVDGDDDYEAYGPETITAKIVKKSDPTPTPTPAPTPTPDPTPTSDPKPDPQPTSSPQPADPVVTPTAPPQGSYAETGLTTKRYVPNGGTTAGIGSVLGTNENQIPLPYVTKESAKAGWTSIDQALKSYKKTKESKTEPFNVTMNGYATVDNQLLSDVNTQKVDLALNLDNDVVVVVPKENKVIKDAINEWNIENSLKATTTSLQTPALTTHALVGQAPATQLLTAQTQQPKLSDDVYFRVSAITTNDAKANRMTNAGLDMKDIQAIGGDANTPVVKVVTSNTSVGILKSQMIQISFDTTKMTVKYKPGDIVYLYNGSAKAGVGCYTVGTVDKDGKVSFWVPMVSSYWTIGNKNLGSKIMKCK